MTVLPVDVLVSYAYHAKTDLRALRDGIGPDAMLMIDSGAFTAHTLGKHIDVDEYADYLERWRGCYDAAVTLDVIGDPRNTAINTTRLRNRGLDVMPVFTVGDEYTTLGDMARDGATYICAGGGVGVKKHTYLPYLTSIVGAAGELGMSVHALGVGSVDMLLKTGAYSGDASTATQSLRWGTIPVWYRGQVRQPSVNQSTGSGRNITGINRLDAHRDWLAGLGVDVKSLLSNPKAGITADWRHVRPAGLFAYAVAGHYVRRMRPQNPPNLPPGPRLVNAILAGDTDLVANVADILRTDPPPAIRRELRAS